MIALNQFSRHVNADVRVPAAVPAGSLIPAATEPDTEDVKVFRQNLPGLTMSETVPLKRRVSRQLDGARIE